MESRRAALVLFAAAVATLLFWLLSQFATSLIISFALLGAAVGVFINAAERTAGGAIAVKTMDIDQRAGSSLFVICLIGLFHWAITIYLSHVDMSLSVYEILSFVVFLPMLTVAPLLIAWQAARGVHFRNETMRRARLSGVALAVFGMMATGGLTAATMWVASDIWPNDSLVFGTSNAIFGGACIIYFACTSLIKKKVDDLGGAKASVDAALIKKQAKESLLFAALVLVLGYYFITDDENNAFIVLGVAGIVLWTMLREFFRIWICLTALFGKGRRMPSGLRVEAAEFTRNKYQTNERLVISGGRGVVAILAKLFDLRMTQWIRLTWIGGCLLAFLVWEFLL